MIPEFYGDENDIEAWGWLLSLEQHFQANQIPEDEMLKEAVKGLRGRALCWYIIWSGLSPHVSWRSFDRAFIGRYIPELCVVEEKPDRSFEADPTIDGYEEEIKKIEEEKEEQGAEKEEQIKKRSVEQDEEEEEQEEGEAVEFDEEIRAELRLQSLNDVGGLMVLAQRVEEKNLVLGMGDLNLGRNTNGLGSHSYSGGRPALTNRKGGQEESRWGENGLGDSAQHNTPTFTNQLTTPSVASASSPNSARSTTVEFDEEREEATAEDRSQEIKDREEGKAKEEKETNTDAEEEEGEMEEEKNGEEEEVVKSKEEEKPEQENDDEEDEAEEKIEKGGQEEEEDAQNEAEEKKEKGKEKKSTSEWEEDFKQKEKERRGAEMVFQKWGQFFDLSQAQQTCVSPIKDMGFFQSVKIISAIILDQSLRSIVTKYNVNMLKIVNIENTVTCYRQWDPGGGILVSPFTLRTR